MSKGKNSVWWSVQCSKEERDTLNEAAKAAGMNRNAFVRQWINNLPSPRGKS